MLAGNVSVGLLLSEKEQEVARLREQALTSLQNKVPIPCTCEAQLSHLLTAQINKLAALPVQLQDKEQQLITAHDKVDFPALVITSRFTTSEDSFNVPLQFLHLQQDYEYNLELLDGRDAELEQYDKDFDAVRQELAGREGLISQLHTRLAKTESGLSHEAVNP